MRSRRVDAVRGSAGWGASPRGRRAAPHSRHLRATVVALQVLRGWAAGGVARARGRCRRSARAASNGGCQGDRAGCVRQGDPEEEAAQRRRHRAGVLLDGITFWRDFSKKLKFEEKYLINLMF